MPESLASLQARFASHIRDPEHIEAPADVEDRRMEIYRGLFFRNLSSFLARSFPVLRSLFDEDTWNRRVRHFYIEHRCHTPLFPEIPCEFLQYLQELDEPLQPPFLLELAHYEWVEIALDLDEQEIDQVPAEPEGDLLQGVPVVSPLAWPLAYRYPVHRIRPDFQPDEPPQQPTHLLVYRDRGDKVRFMRLNAVSDLVVRQLKEDSGRTGHDVLNAVADELDHPDPALVTSAGAGLLQDLKDRDVILGTRPNP